MLEEFKKSVNATLYERATSPFFGTLFVSWIICNWQIIIILFFVDEKILNTNKVSYIKEHLSDVNTLVYFPLISTIVLLTLVPFITNGAYWLSLNFQKWRYDKKNSVENLKLLTLEKSIQLREEIQNQQDKFEKLLHSKNQEIELLTKQIENNIKLAKDFEFADENQEKLNPEFLEILKDEKRFNEFGNIVWKIQNNYKMFGGSDAPSSDFVSYLEANNILDNSNNLYKFTKLGKELLKEYTKLKIK